MLLHVPLLKALFTVGSRLHPIAVPLLQASFACAVVIHFSTSDGTSSRAPIVVRNWSLKLFVRRKEGIYALMLSLYNYIITFLVLFAFCMDSDKLLSGVNYFHPKELFH